MEKRKWTEHEVALLQEHYSQVVLSREDLVRTLGRSWSAIQEKARLLGLRHHARREVWSAEQLQLLKQLYANLSVSTEDIAHLLAKEHRAVINMAYRLKLKRFDYNIQHDYFSIINSPLQAYHLGLLAADGNVQEQSGVISLSLQEQDRAVVERYRDALIPDGPVHEGKGQCRVAFTSWPMMENLARFGIAPRKSAVFNWPAQLPVEYHVPFLLGYFDGDGALYQIRYGGRVYWRWHLVGTYPFVCRAKEFVEQSLGLWLGEPKRVRKDACPFLYFITTSKQSSVYAIDRLLNTSGLGMKRKHFPPFTSHGIADPD